MHLQSANVMQVNDKSQWLLEINNKKILPDSMKISFRYIFVKLCNYCWSICYVELHEINEKIKNVKTLKVLRILDYTYSKSLINNFK